MKWALASLSIALAACPSDDVTGGPDGGDGPAGRGLVVAWSARPEVIPGDVDNEHTLDAATLSLRNVRAIGDAGSDPRTLAPAVELRWATGVTPPDLAFPDAPTGLYARMSLELDRGAGAYAYELTGTVEIASVVEPFTIRDRDPLAISMDYQITLPPGAGARIPVRIELDDVVGAVDFARAPVVSGRRVIETGDPQLAAVRAELVDAFGVHSDL